VKERYPRSKREHQPLGLEDWCLSCKCFGRDFYSASINLLSEVQRGQILKKYFCAPNLFIKIHYSNNFFESKSNFKIVENRFLPHLPTFLPGDFSMYILHYSIYLLVGQSSIVRLEHQTESIRHLPVFFEFIKKLWAPDH